MSAGPSLPRVRIGIVCSVGVGIGHGGRAENEDNYLVARDGRATRRDGGAERSHAAPSAGSIVLAVADGMGGHESGHVASADAVDALAPLHAAPAPADPEAALRAHVLDAHARLHERAAVAGRVRMGTTLTVAWLWGAQLFWSHVGDSRLYLWRNGRIVRLTRDHTRAEFARRDGRSEPAYPHNLSQNFIYGSRGLGNDAGIRIDAGLDTGALELLAGDRLLLCSDGLSGPVTDARIGEVLGNVTQPEACAVALFDRAIASGSEDNVTAVVADIEALPGGATAPSRTIVPFD
jgi:serine/threonine protein phosphatase PrpC